MAEIVYLSRRNIQTLLNKLDRNKVTPGASKCTLIKKKGRKAFEQTMESIKVIAVEDDVYYVDSPPTPVLPVDEPKCS